MYRRENLVVLTYDRGNLELKALGKNSEHGDDFEVNEKKGIWKRKYDSRLHTIKIGEGFSMQKGHRWGVLGVYDKTNIEHLNLMIFEIEKLDYSNCCLED